jgi:sugar phosphate isomerase/epimerase
LAEIAAHPNSPNSETAEGYWRQAMVLADELGMRPLVAHCHLGLGKFYRRTAYAGRSQEHLTIAATMYREMGMNLWLAQAEEAESAQRLIRPAR